MKTLAAFFTICLLLWALPVSAGACRNLEYAEIQDMSDRDLMVQYCLFGSLHDLYYNTFKEYAALGAIGKMKEMSKTMDVCSENLSKMRTALKKRSLPEKPNCEALKSGK